MSSFTLPISNVEELPDEILLLIYRYLSSTDILFSFYGLNSRFSQTISGFYQHFVLGHVSFKQFNYICKSILPDIGINICSLVVSNDWKGILSQKFLNYFSDKISLTFPRLRRLILTTFRIGTLMSFIDCFQNLPELFELKLISLYDVDKESAELEILLHRIFTANNNRLTSILFDDDSLSFPCVSKDDICYPHIEKLTVELKTTHDLYELLTVLPQLKFLDVAINDVSSKFLKEIQHIPVLTLKKFRLRSFVHNWNLNELALFLKRIPNVQELIIQIKTNYDIRLIDGQQIFSYISSLSLTKFSYFLEFDYSQSFNYKSFLSNWQQFNQEFICIESDDNNTLVLITLPFDCPYLFLRCSVAKNKIFMNNYGSQVKCLTLLEVSTQLAEIFSIITKCHRIQTIVLRIDETIVPKSTQQIQLCKLPYLKCFVALEKTSVNADDFRKLLEIAPSLYHLAVNYEFIAPMFDNKSVCYFLEHRITHLLINVTSITSLESAAVSISQLAIVFPSLKHLYFYIETHDGSVESLILSVLNHLCKWNYLVSFGVANIKIDSKILTKGIREWVLENSFLNDNDTFLTDYSAETFRLWL
ncbi:unnamed protein product [Rotaria sp. Silwood2]|nr:unnamed protein product [Rotaria sp. Silwood2]CAF4138604.1 unnamed protein product [Rotaria sp. Silwood2]